MSTGARPRRDVERNRETILTAAIAVLADAPEATMNDIALASGVGRSTLYRHFPDRSALVKAIAARVLTEAVAVIDEHLDAAGDRDPLDVLVELTSAIVGLGDRYRFLERHEARRHKRPGDDRKRGGRLRLYISAGQRAGAIRDDLDADWLFTMLAHTFVGAVESRFEDVERRDRVVAATVRSLFAPPGAHQG